MGALSNGGSLQDYGQAQKAVLQHAQASGYAVVQRDPVSRQDLIEMSLKLQEALSLITQALGRMR